MGTCEQTETGGQTWKRVKMNARLEINKFLRDEREKNMRPSEAVWKKQFGKFEERKRESIKK